MLKLVCKFNAEKNLLYCLQGLIPVLVSAGAILSKAMRLDQTPHEYLPLYCFLDTFSSPHLCPKKT